jgi:hypothetical protein
MGKTFYEMVREAEAGFEKHFDERRKMTHDELLHRLMLVRQIIEDIEAEDCPTPAEDETMWMYARGRQSVADTFRKFTPWLWELD